MDPVHPPENAEIKLHFLDYWRIIRIRKTVILAVFLLVVITAVSITFFMPEIYSSTVKISVEKESTDISSMAGQSSSQSYDPFWLMTQFEIIQSSSILNQVIEDKTLDLNKRWAAKYTTDGRPLRTEESLRILRNMMSVRQSHNTSLIEISVFDENKNDAATIANKIAEVYKNQRVNERQLARKEGVKTLRERLAESEIAVSNMQSTVSRLMADKNVPDMGEGSPLSVATMNTETMRKLESQRLDAQEEFGSFSNLLASILRVDRKQLRESIATILPNDNTLSMLSQDLATSEKNLAVLRQDLKPENPDLKKLEASVDTTRAQLDAKITGTIEGLRTRVAQFGQHMTELDAKVRQAVSNNVAMAKDFQPYWTAKRDLESLKHVRELLILKITQEEIDTSLPVSTMVKITDVAKVEDKAVRPNKPLVFALAAVVGVVLGVGLAFFIEYLDTSVKTIDDVERTLQAPVLGVIPQNVAPLLDEGPESPHAEAYRVLRTNVLFSRKDETFNTLTVISGGAGEGKSTTLFNLATIFAQNGHRVLVVDSDLRRPSIHKVLRVSNNIGLTNYLLKQNTLEEVIQTTSLATMDFMPSGKLPSSSMGILSSAKMREMIKELKLRYDFVFFDSPPIMGVSDASILASEMDMVLQVIQYRRYPQQMTIRAKQMVQKVGGNLLGLVLNNINMSQDENYYYYSGYYYDYYSKHDEQNPVKDEGAAKKVAALQTKPEIKNKY